VGDHKIRVIQLDDASDPSNASRNASKLVEEENVDILIGTASTPSSAAMAAVAVAKKVPLISVSPLPPTAPGDGGPWVVAIPQPPPLMAKAVVDRMKSTGAKTVGYIGYSDSWGDLVYDGLTKAADADGIKVTSNERYARADSSVTAQALKIVASRPDAIMTGGSGTPGALPYIALKERGYTGPIYGMHSLINPDFIRVGGAAVEGAICPTGPVVVAEQLPESNPIRGVSLKFREAYQKANGAPATDAFSAYSFDAWLVFLDAAKRAMASGAKPGTPEFRTALKNAMFTTKDLVGTHAVYNFKPGESYGVDERSLVLVRLEGGQWKYQP
jgi:branched-chain amino acid transport system substrate-binding protein